MFERFTADARAVVVGAQTDGPESGARSIDARHLLLGLTETAGAGGGRPDVGGARPDELARDLRAELRSGGLDAAALASVGIDLEAVRASADAVFGKGALDRARRSPAKGHIPFTADAKKALELALREAVRLHTQPDRRRDAAARDCCGGPVRRPSSPCSRALAEVGSTPDAAPAGRRASGGAGVLTGRTAESRSGRGHAWATLGVADESGELPQRPGGGHDRLIPCPISPCWIRSSSASWARCWRSSGPSPTRTRSR